MVKFWQDLTDECKDKFHPGMSQLVDNVASIAHAPWYPHGGSLRQRLDSMTTAFKATDAGQPLGDAMRKFTTGVTIINRAYELRKQLETLDQKTSDLSSLGIDSEGSTQKLVECEKECASLVTRLAS